MNVIAIIVYVLFLLMEKRNLHYIPTKNLLTISGIVFVTTIALTLEPMIGIMVVLILLVFNYDKLKINKKIFISIAACSLYIILNTLIIFGTKRYDPAFNPYIGCIELVSYFLFFILLKIIMLNDIQKIKLYKIISLYSVGVFVVCILDMLQTGFLVRQDAIFVNPNLLGIYSAGICAINIVIGNKVLSAFSNNLILIVSGIMLLVSQSRVAWIGFCVFLMCEFLKAGIKKKFKFLIVMILGGAIILLILPNTFIDSIMVRINSGFDVADYSTMDRLKLVECAIEIFRNNLFWGSGIRTFTVEAQKLGFNYYSTNVVHPHNAYLEILSTLGLVGGILYTIIIKYIISYRKNNKYMSVFIMYLSFGLLNRLFNEYATSIIFWTVLAFL